MTTKRWRVAVAAVLALLLVCAWLSWSQDAAREHTEAGLKRALVAYAAARAINAVISVAQSAQVSFQPGGIGVATNPAEVLDPLNDLVEQFSSLMLLASVAFGIQRLLAEAGAHTVVTVALSLSLVVVAALLLRQRAVPRALASALAVLLLVRFAMPVTVIASERLHAALFQERYAAATAAIDRAAGGSASAPAAGAPAPPQRWGDWAPWLKKTPEEARPTAEAADGVISRMRAFFEEGVNHFVMLAAIFVVHTVALPLGVLWLLAGALRALVRSGAATDRRPA